MNRWDRRFAEDQSAAGSPAFVLSEFAHLLPMCGEVLDYACGRGANALFLAEQGLQVSAWDYSVEALKKLKRDADSLRLSIKTRNVDLEANDFCITTLFDVIVVSNYLYRPAFAKIIDGLKPGGLLFYQTFVQDKVNPAGPSSPDYLLKTNELLRLCQPLQIVAYREEGSLGDTSKGLRNQACLIGRK